MRTVRLLLGVGVALIVGALGLGALAFAQVRGASTGRIVDLAQAPERGVAIVFGTAVGSTLLRDRVETAAALYRAGKVRHLLLSGDNRFRSYDEPNAMRKLALELGVPAGAIVLDYAGRRTYDSCARARDIFRVGDGEHAAHAARGTILVTQRFHLFRAVYLCRALGLDDVIGVAADRRDYRAGTWLTSREVLANVRAWLDVHVRRPPVVGGRVEPIVDERGEDDRGE